MTKKSNKEINVLKNDLDYILKQSATLLEGLRDNRLFITGGTGFLGSWLLESLVWANINLDLNVSALVLTRNYQSFKKKAPHLALNPAIRFQIGDVKNYDFPKEKFDYIIHAAATTAEATYYKTENALEKFDTIINGTRHTLNFALQCQAKKFLLTSSGAVYGQQPYNMTHIPEDFFGIVDSTKTESAWAVSKRAAEFLCAFYTQEYGLETKIARLFTFVGPYLPLNIHYAIGNFIQDRLENRPIIIKGDGSPHRSYLYAADLVVWIWTILLKGLVSRPYNVGSETDISILSLAKTIAKMYQPKLEIQIIADKRPNQPIKRYVPSTKRAQKELDLRQTISLQEAIKRTITWHKKIV